LWLNQDTTFSTGEFDEEQQINYQVKRRVTGVYIFVLEGGIKINGEQLNKRDAIGVYETDSLSIQTNLKTRLLIIEVPMNY
jgi:redox-sensitive bicupin YhaK (pirin superfamily)